ncbi:MAG: hypothetical protein ACREFR_14335 [Limisphaerales bacterium]
MVRDAVRRMREHDDHHCRLLVALEIGERDVPAGRALLYTPDLLKQWNRNLGPTPPITVRQILMSSPKRRPELSQQAEEDPGFC